MQTVHVEILSYCETLLIKPILHQIEVFGVDPLS